MDWRFLFHPQPRVAAPGPAEAGRLTGPIKGYFVLAYAVPARGAFAGRSRVYRQRPVGGGDDGDLLRELATVGSYDTQEAALRAAEHQARFYIQGLACNWEPFPPPT